VGNLFIFIKAAKGKRKKGVCATWHDFLSNGRDVFSFFLCGFYEKRCRQYGRAKPAHTHHFPEECVPFPVTSVKMGAGLSPTTDQGFCGQPCTRFRGCDAATKRGRRVPMVTSLLSEESAVFEAHRCDPKHELGVIAQGVTYSATSAFSARNIGIMQRAQNAQRGYGGPFYFLKNLGFLGRSLPQRPWSRTILDYFSLRLKRIRYF
jgi:hypothetical protein